MKSFWELYGIDLPLFCCESSFYMTSKSLAGLRVAGIFEIVVTYRKLGIWFLYVRVVHDAYVATSEDRAFVWIACDGELRQIQSKFLSKIHGKYKRSHWLIRSPMFLTRIPSQRRIPSNNFPILSLYQSDRSW